MSTFNDKVKNLSKESFPTKVSYLGRLVDESSFRTIIYALDNKPRLVESYEEFKDAIATGLWFAEKCKPNPILAPKSKGKPMEALDANSPPICGAKLPVN